MAKSKKTAAVQQVDKAVTLPLNADEMALIETYRNNKKSTEKYFEFKATITPEHTSIDVTPICLRGSESEKRELMYAQMCDYFGTKDMTIVDTLLNSVTRTISFMYKKPSDTAEAMQVVLSMIGEMKPHDHLEAMLIGQMIGLHFQSSDYLNQSCNGNLSAQAREVYVSHATKLSRLFNEKVETLMRYRRKGEQKVVVQHVNIGSGGQAIVGNVQTGGSGLK